MHDGLTGDFFNPRFTHVSPVHLDELDSFGRLERPRFEHHVDEAIAAWQMNMDEKDEQCLGVRDLSLEMLGPVLGPTTLRIDVWVERLEESSLVYGFTCSNESGSVAYARGERTMTKLDPQSHRPLPWSERFLDKHLSLTKNLPAYA